PALLILVAIFAADLRLVYPYVTDAANYYPPNYTTFQPPDVGGSYVDPIFGTVVKRMRNAMTTPDISVRSGVVVSMTPEFSTMSPFNLDNTRVLVVFRSYFALYDGAGNKINRDLPLEVNASSEPRWSRKDPNTFYYLRGNQLKRFNIA